MAAQLKSFSDRHLWIGPTVWMLSSLYFLAQVFVGWVWKPPYSVIHNTISDLGNTACGTYRQSYVCSPRHDVMDATFVLLGIVMATGSLLLYQEFTERARREQRAALAGFTLMALAGVGTMLVGLFPENTISYMHITGAGIAIGGGNLGILILGLVLPLPEGLRGSMVGLSIVSIVALICFASGHYFGIGGGTMERIAAYPETVWLIRFGLYISRNHFARSAAESTA
jgi:hypothetical membrane protein